MGLDSFSQLRTLNEQAKHGDLSEEEFRTLLTHLEESPDEFTSLAGRTLYNAVRSEPSRYGEARRFLWSFVHASLNREGEEVQQLLIKLSSVIALACLDDLDRLSDSYREFTDDLLAADRLESNLSGINLALPLVISDEYEYATAELVRQCATTAQRALDHLSGGTLSASLLFSMATMSAAVEDVESETLPEAVVERLDPLQLFGYHDPKIRSNALSVFGALAEDDPEPFRPYIGALGTRLIREEAGPTPTPETPTGSAPHDTDGSLWARRAGACRILAACVSIAPNAVARVAGPVPELLTADRPEAQIYGFKLAMQLHVSEADFDATAHESELRTAIADASGHSEWLSEAGVQIVELSMNEAYELAATVSDAMVSEMETTPPADEWEAADAFSLIMLVRSAPSEAVISYLLANHDSFDEDDWTASCRSLVQAFATHPWFAQRLDEHTGEVLAIIEEYGPALIEDGAVERDALREACAALAGDGVPEDIAAALDAANADAE